MQSGFYTDLLRKLFTDVSYSSRGSSARIKEETAFMHFVDYLDDCEGGSYTVLNIKIMYLILPMVLVMQLMQ